MYWDHAAGVKKPLAIILGRQASPCRKLHRFEQASSLDGPVQRVEPGVIPKFEKPA